MLTAKAQHIGLIYRGRGRRKHRVLSPYRVLDLTDERGHLAGLMLAMFGAEVIKIEPPGGIRTRQIGPFDASGASLTHAAYDRGKKSVVIDLESLEGKNQLRDLVKEADCLIESLGPCALDKLGLTTDSLLEINPSLVIGTLTAFGHSGPKAFWPATDITLMASACTMAFTGDADRSPVRVGVPQAFHFGAAAMAGGVIAGLYERGHSGVGQVIDVSAQQVIPIATQGGVLSEACNYSAPVRSGGGASVGPIDLRFVYPAKDGFVSITHVFGEVIGHVTAELMRWCLEEGFTTPEIVELDWVNFATLLESGEVSITTWEQAKTDVANCTASKTKAELLAVAMERRILMAPIADLREVVNSAQLSARGYFDDLDIGDQRILAPGAFAQVDPTPLKPLPQVSKLGADTEKILASNHYSVSKTPTTKISRKPLDGVKVVDFTWSLAGPYATRVLADLGATVVKIESSKKPDAARGFLPIWDNIPGSEQSAMFDSANAGKLSLSLDLSKPEAISVVHDLVGWADLVSESFSPKVMAGWGLGYEQLAKINKQIIMVSTCLNGQYGPLASFAGYGNLGAALSGFYGLAGWPDRPPAGPFGAYTDYTSTHFLIATILAALDQQRRTRMGAYIDLAQAEAAQHFISPALLDISANDHLISRSGNNDEAMVPHGGFQCQGDDNWIAIAVIDDNAWRELCRVIDRPDLEATRELKSLGGRKAARAIVEGELTKWTRSQSIDDAESQLIAAGIAAHRVQSSDECLADPQLAHRDAFLWMDHPNRRSIIENSRFKMSRSECKPTNRAPFVGEHTFNVLADILNYDGDRIADLAAAEVLE
jgi:crotonobetainyl-CoA:carnitine CoA-transferase CaiB-like acyl-CoA transferase|tara:strand:+ start:1746 stop:4226 length:2481 start_codon:yes stop_codon:yes gene_type:complete